MAVVHMHIEKFGGVVKINDDHPLAIAQRAKDAAQAQQAPAAEGGDPASVPAAAEASEETPAPVTEEVVQDEVVEPTPEVSVATQAQQAPAAGRQQRRR